MPPAWSAGGRDLQAQKNQAGRFRPAQAGGHYARPKGLTDCNVQVLYSVVKPLSSLLL